MDSWIIIVIAAVAGASGLTYWAWYDADQHQKWLAVLYRSEAE